MQTYLLILAYIIMVSINALANILPINNQTTAEISNKLQVAFTPAGYVFSIWGLIYFLLAIWLFRTFIRRTSRDALPTKIGRLFITSCLLNASWLLAFHYELFILSTIIIILLLITLMTIYQSYPTNNNQFGGRLPFSFYLGWITVATVANMSYTLTFYDIYLGINEIPGTIILVILAAAIGITGRYISHDPYFASVFVWAIIGIAQANQGTSLETVAYIVAIVIFIAIIASPLVSKKKATHVS